MKRKRSKKASGGPDDSPAEGAVPAPAAGGGAAGGGVGLPAGQRRTLALAFFLSGAATLVLEVVWAKVLGYVLGNTTYAVGTVVAAFMAGLALGSALAARLSRRIREPLKIYAVIELLLSVCAVASVPLFSATTPLFQWVHGAFPDADPAHAGFFLLRFGIVFLLMLVPVTLMGTTLPLVVGAFARGRKAYGREAGLLYGVNTLGAVAGTLLAGFVLIPVLGLFGSACAAGAAQLMVALAAFAGHRRLGASARTLDPAQDAEAFARAPWSPLQWLIAGTFLSSGAVAMLLEVAWFRLLTLVTGPSAAAFAILLATFLAAVGLGSVLVGARVERIERPLRAMALGQLVLGITILSGMALYNSLPAIHAAAPGGGQLGAQFFVAALVMFLPCLVMGALFPITVRALSSAGARRAAEHNVGRLYVGNTLGAIVGSLATAFWLLPGLGLGGVVTAGALVNVALGLGLGLAGEKAGFARPGAIAAGLALLLVLVLPPLKLDELNRGRYLMRRAVVSESEEEPAMLYHREGASTTVAIYRTEGHVDLRVAGKVDASNSPGDLRTQLFVGRLPVMLARDPRRAAVIGYGSGMSAGAVLQHREVQSLDVLEIEPAVVEAAQYFSSINGEPLRDPRTRLVLEDGRVFLTYTDRTYDVIASEPSNPWIAGVANLFTTDFYRIVRARLGPGGVFGQWIQLYEISDEVFETMLASLHEIFPYVVLFMPEATDIVAVASAEPIVLPWSKFEARFAEPAVRAGGAALGLRHPAHLLAHFAAGPAQTQLLVDGIKRRNTDDNVWLERRLSRDFLRMRERTIDLPLGTRLVESRLSGMQEVFTGLPAEEVSEHILRYLHEFEPRFDEKNRVWDEWAQYRKPIALGLIQSLRAQDPEAAARIETLFDDVQKAWQAREQATELLLRATLGRGAGGGVREAVQKAQAIAPELPAVLWMAGELAVAAKNDAQAEVYFKRALDVPWHKVFTDVVISLSRLYARTNRVEEAESLLGELVAQNPYWTQAHLGLVHLRLEAGDRAGAAEALERALYFNPGVPELLALRRQVGG